MKPRVQSQLRTLWTYNALMFIAMILVMTLTNNARPAASDASAYASNVPAQLAPQAAGAIPAGEDGAVSRETARNQDHAFDTPKGPISMADYERLRTGMDQLEVWMIIPQDDCHEGASSGTVIQYDCTDHADGVMSIMFANGDLLSKAQNGLR